MLDSALLIAALFLVTFLLGSIPWGLVISKLFFHKDIRNEGSGNIGTTNAMRSMGKVGGGAVFLLDFGKGLLSGFLATLFANSLKAAFAGAAVEAGNLGGAVVAVVSDDALALCLGVAFLGCVWGHIFSPWLKFKGGKGIAVAVGCLFFTFGPVGALLEIAVFTVLVAATRYVSVGSLAAAAVCPFIACWCLWGHGVAIALVTLGALTVIWAHRGNITRLRDGNERRIGGKKKEAAAS